MEKTFKLDNCGSTYVVGVDVASGESEGIGVVRFESEIVGTFPIPGGAREVDVLDSALKVIEKYESENEVECEDCGCLFFKGKGRFEDEYCEKCALERVLETGVGRSYYEE